MATTPHGQHGTHGSHGARGAQGAHAAHDSHAAHGPHADTRRPRRGISVAAKLALFIALVVAAFMVVFGLVFSRFVEDTVKSQILVAAVEAARTGALADVDAWSAWFGTTDQGLSADQIQARVSVMTPFEFRAYDTEERKAAIERNRKRLLGALGKDSRILAMEVFPFTAGQREERLVAASYEGGMRFAPALGVRPVTYDRGEATEGLLTLGGTTRHVIRGSYPIVARDGSQSGEVAVYIHATAVDEATADFKLKVAYAAGVFVFVGAGISFLLGKAVTRPLRMLQEDIRIVASGDLGHHTRPHSKDEIGELARTFDQMTASLAAARDAEREAAASRRQMAVAAEVTASLVPSRLPRIEGYDCASVHDETGQPSGECHDVLALPGGRHGFLVASASGSGVPAAMVMAMARSYLRVVAHGEPDPGKLLRQVNALLSGDLRKGMYVSVLVVVLEPASGRVSFANAGHAPLLHWSAAEELLTPVHSEGIALGFDKGPVFDRTLKLAELVLAPGDRLALYTAGITHVAGSDGSELGEQRLLGLVRREAHHDAETFARRIEATLRKFHGSDDLDCDVTLLTLGRRPA